MAETNFIYVKIHKETRSSKQQIHQRINKIFFFAFYGKTMKILRDEKYVKLVKSDDFETM